VNLRNVLILWETCFPWRVRVSDKLATVCIVAVLAGTELLSLNNLLNNSLNSVHNIINLMKLYIFNPLSSMRWLKLRRFRRLDLYNLFVVTDKAMSRMYC